MKIMYPRGTGDSYPYQFPVTLKEFPNELMNEKYADEIHGQTLARLEERGGLSPCEILVNVLGLSFRWISNNPSTAKQVELLKHIIETVPTEDARRK